MADDGMLISPARSHASSSSTKRSPSVVRQKIDKIREKRHRRNRSRSDLKDSSAATSASASTSALDTVADARSDTATSWSALPDDVRDRHAVSDSNSEYASSFEDGPEVLLTAPVVHGRPRTGSLPAMALDMDDKPPALLSSSQSISISAANTSAGSADGSSNGRAVVPQPEVSASSGLMTGTNFFSSMLSAAQNAATTITSLASISTPKKDELSHEFHNRPRSETEPAPRLSGDLDGLAPVRSRAIDTLGHGQLNLTDLVGPSPPEPTDSALVVPSDTLELAPVVSTATNANTSTNTASPNTTVSSVVSVPPSLPAPKADADQSSDSHPSSAAVDRNASVARSRSVVPSRSRRSVSVHRNPSVSTVDQGQGGLPVSNPGFNGSTARITGYAVASPKRNREFHQLFRSVPEEDSLIEDYGCALSREILLQGRLYISEQHICFNSNILGWVTNLVISFDEVMSLEKRTTAGLFQNAIMVQTLHARNVFASLISRDSTFDLMYKIWQNGGMPNSSSSDTGSIYSSGGESGNDDGSDNNGGDGDRSTEKNEAGDAGGAGAVSVATTEFGPAKHAPTQCACAPAEHYKIVCDEKVNAPLGTVSNLLWGEDLTFFKHFMTTVSKLQDLTTPTAFDADESGKKTRKFNYVKPLNYSIGPKQTRCNTTETILNWDYETYVSTIVTTETPDVPYGNQFLTKTKYCLTWGENNTTRILIMCVLDWTGKPFIKGAIEKGATEGQIQTSKDLVEALRQALQPKLPKARAGRKGGRRRGKHPEKVIQPAQTAPPPPTTLIGKILSVINQPQEGVYVTYIMIILLALFVILFLCVLLRGGRRGGDPVDGLRGVQALWDLEEQRLWEWLDDRTATTVGIDTRDTTAQAQKRGLVHERGWLSLYEVEQAIDVTQRRLDFLKAKLDRRRQTK
ncbi:uncharacterized protein V1518DRAFT_431545 [Limtongia smithiae]|uniref:uncharacterized protein n=1 Tax=Limtongia smithiae TaxID=1125753 RepID=UPI0034CF12D0